MTKNKLFMAALAASLLATSAIGETITASAKDVSVTWQPDAQTVETRSSADAYTHAAYELRPIMSYYPDGAAADDDAHT